MPKSEYPLYGSTRNAKLLGNDPDGLPGFVERKHAIPVEDPRWPPEAFPLGSGPAEARLDALPDWLTLELRHQGEGVPQEAVLGSGRTHVGLGGGHHLDPPAEEIMDESNYLEEGQRVTRLLRPERSL